MMRSALLTRFSPLLGCFLLLGAVACSDDDATGSGTTTTSTSSGDGGGGTGGGGTGGGTGGTGTGGTGTGGTGTGGGDACVVQDVPCEDEVLLQMDLKDADAAGLIGSTPDGDGFVSTIDATAGGAFSITDSYTYGVFTENGLEKVDLTDEEALESTDWDIGFRRYVVRINSGHSGPSCVTAARVPGDDAFEAVTAEPDGLVYRTDEYFTESCELIADGTGLPGSPATALSSYWTYPGCVQMTGNVYVIKKADGSKVKFTVDQYYNDENHESCQADGTVAEGDTGAANFIVRWAFLP